MVINLPLLMLLAMQLKERMLFRSLQRVIATAQPYYRPLYPYFNPEAEQHWIAVAGLKQNG